MIINTIVKGSGGGDVVDVAAVGQAVNAVENDKVFLYPAAITTGDIGVTGVPVVTAVTASSDAVGQDKGGQGVINGSYLNVYPNMFGGSTTNSTVYGEKGTDGVYSCAGGHNGSYDKAVMHSVRLDTDYYLCLSVLSTVSYMRVRTLQGHVMSSDLYSAGRYVYFIVGDVPYVYKHGTSETAGCLFTYESGELTSTTFSTTTNRTPVALIEDSGVDTPTFINASGSIRRFDTNAEIATASGIPSSRTRLLPFDKYGKRLLDCLTGVVYQTTTTTGDRTYTQDEDMTAYFANADWSSVCNSNAQYFNGKVYFTNNWHLWIFDQATETMTDCGDLFQEDDFTSSTTYTTTGRKTMCLDLDNNTAMASFVRWKNAASSPTNVGYIDVRIKSINDVVPYDFTAHTPTTGPVIADMLTGWVAENKGADDYGNTVLSVKTVLDPLGTKNYKIIGDDVTVSSEGAAEGFSESSYIVSTEV